MYGRQNFEISISRLIGQLKHKWEVDFHIGLFSVRIAGGFGGWTPYLILKLKVAANMAAKTLKYLYLGS